MGMMSEVPGNYLVYFFSHLLPKPRTYFYVCLIDGTARIFPTSYAATKNRIHISSVEPLLKDLNPGHYTD